MSTEVEAKKPKPPKPHKVKATVSFPISPKGPYKEEVSSDLTVGELRKKAMTNFGIAEDGQHDYYLSHDGARIADETTVGTVSGEAKAAKFTLVKELVQG